MRGPFLLRGLGRIGPGALLVEDGRIAALDDDALARGRGAQSIDATGLVAVPGFIELQINGIGGHDFTTAPASIWEVGPMLARHGVTTFLPTILSAPPGTVEEAISVFDGRQTAGAVPIGLHLEGPYLAPARAGAHAPENLRDPDPDEAAAWLGTGAVRMLTIAPERPRALEVVAAAVAAGAVVSIGHSDADAGITRTAIDAGARYATHLFNAMPPLGHRHPGAVGALLADARVTLGLIVDGQHLDPIVVGLVTRLAGDRVSLVSDAIEALGLPPGEHRLGDGRVTVEDGAARRPDGTLAGSVIGLDECVRRYAAIAGAKAAVDAVTATPARLLGLGDRGALVVGARADITLLDDELCVRGTLVGGEIAFDGDGRWP